MVFFGFKEIRKNLLTIHDLIQNTTVLVLYIKDIISFIGLIPDSVRFLTCTFRRRVVRVRVLLPIPRRKDRLGLVETYRYLQEEEKYSDSLKYFQRKGAKMQSVTHVKIQN